MSDLFSKEALPQRRCRGFCRVCCRFEQMTFEHLPPKAAGNRQTVRSVPYEVWSGHGDLRSFPDRGWSQQQKGTGGYVLCGRCNSTTGTRWVPEYGDWARMGQAVLAEAGPFAERLPAGAHECVRFGFKGVYPGRFARQVLTMLLAASGGPTTAAKNPEVQQIILEGACKLPGDVRVFMRLFVGPGIRLLPISGAIDLSTMTREVSMEVAFPPFAFVAVVGGEPRDDLGLEITDWSEMDPDEPLAVKFELPVGHGYTPFPGDYRPVGQIEDEASASREGRSAR